MNRVCSIFSQLLQLFPRLEFEQVVKEHRGERHARGFTCWGQFVAMLFCHLGKAQSLREICGGLAASEGKLRHLGVREAPKRSTLSYANEHRPWEVYRSVFERLLGRCQAVVGRRQKFRFKNKLLSLDASVIDLCARLYDWARYRRTKGGVKLHLLLDHDGYLPTFAVIEAARVPEVKIARQLRFEAGTIVVCDRGYIDYGWFQSLTEEGVFFVTRMRRDMVYRVVEERAVPQNRQVLADQVVSLGSHNHRLKVPLRRLEVWQEEQQERLVFLTNHLSFGATTVAAIYRDRWQIELFFKALKQSLRVKTFVGTSPNALKTQIWTALIAMLLLKYLQLRSRYGWSLSNLVALLRQQLFVYRDLWSWLDCPFQAPPGLEGIHDGQLVLGF
jgi:uncharacterized protein DUF4372/DDE family transposase